MTKFTCYVNKKKEIKMTYLLTSAIQVAEKQPSNLC
jgi:hypothetical protein